MSGPDMDDASSALIAKLLMQDQLGADYDPELFGKIGDEDDEYAPVPGSRRKKASGGTPAKRGRKAAEPKPAPAAAEPTDPEIDLGKKDESPEKKKDEPVMGTGFYNEEEEKKFLEGLELFGRDWGAMSKHIGTRDRNSVRSHTQKWLLRMYRDNIPLPAKMKETGEGYTLSGKPLDPESAAARPYLQANAPRNPANNEQSTTGDGDAKAEKAEKAEKPKRRKERAPSPPPTPVPTSEVTVLGRTRYAKDRLRQNTSVTVQHLREMTTRDPLTMVKCVGIDEGDEPFQFEIHSHVLLVVDFHSHLCDSEIIGFLGGTWNSDSRKLVVTEAFPCRSVAPDSHDVDVSINVEMSPESDVAVREEIQAKGLQVVGWYHSHPVFQPDPSIRDIENQASYQQLCKDHVSGVEPFVGMIVSPYDVRLPTEVSQVNYFMVQRPNKGDAIGIPIALVVTVLPDTDVPEQLIAKLDGLADLYATFSERSKMDEVWRYFAPPTDPNAPTPLKPVTKLQKLEASILARLQKTLASDAAAKQSARIIQQLHRWTPSKMGLPAATPATPAAHT